MFLKRTDKFTIINNNAVYICTSTGKMDYTASHDLPVDAFAPDKGDLIPPKEIDPHKNALMIVPDYWFGSNIYQFDSTKKSIVEAFLDRKLQTEFPNIPEIINFYGYQFIQTRDRKRAVYVYYLQEMGFYNVYRVLLKWQFHPQRITSAAFVSQSIVTRAVTDIETENYALISLLPLECLLYFFAQGQFLFSRSITLPQNSMASDGLFDLLTYEINQSQYLYSQKAGTQIEKFYILSREAENADRLSQTLDRPVIDLSELACPAEYALPDHLGPVGLFREQDWADPSIYLSLAHKIFNKEQAWRRAQLTGIVLGIVLLLMLGIEAVYLYNWEQPGRHAMRQAGMAAALSPQEAIRQYNMALDNLLQEARRPAPRDILGKVATSLPEKVHLEEISVNLPDAPEVDIRAKVRAADIDALQQTLDMIIDQINSAFSLYPKLKIDDIDFNRTSEAMEPSGEAYLVHFRFNLP